MPPGWQEGPDGLDGICNDRDRAMGAGLVAFHRHADFARWAIGAAGSRFVEAGEAAPELDYRLRHHQAAALHAFHRLVSFCPLHEAIPRQWSNTTRTKAAGQQWRCRVWRRRHTKSYDVGGFIASACSPRFRTRKRLRSPQPNLSYCTVNLPICTVDPPMRSAAAAQASGRASRAKAVTQEEVNGETGLTASGPR